MTESPTERPSETVRRFCAAWSDLDIDTIMGFFADDAVYHNIPLDPVVGTAAIREFIEGFTAGVERIDFDVRTLVADGSLVLTERVDTFVTPERSIALPVMGAFELRADGTIVAWRDYFDLQTVMAGLAG